MKQATKNAGPQDPAQRTERVSATAKPDKNIDHLAVPGKRKSRFSQVSCLACATVCQFLALVLSDVGGDLTRGAFLMAHWRESMMHKGGVA